MKLLKQGFLLVKLKSSLRKIYGHHHDFVDHYGIQESQMTMCSTCHTHLPVLSSFMAYHRVSNKISMTGVTSGAGTHYPSGAPECIPRFQWGSCNSIFSLMCMLCRSFFVLYSFGHCVVCPSIYYFWLPPLISSNSSYARFMSHFGCVFL